MGQRSVQPSAPKSLGEDGMCISEVTCLAPRCMAHSCGVSNYNSSLPFHIQGIFFHASLVPFLASVHLFKRVSGFLSGLKFICF